MQSSSSTPSSLGEGIWGRASEGLPAPTSTPIGGRSFASPAMIRILLTPAHAKVTPDEFEMMAGIVRRFDSVSLTDLPAGQSRSQSIRKSFLEWGKPKTVKKKRMTDFLLTHETSSANPHFDDE